MSALILFDFDGTLAYTAPDLAAAANRQRTRKGLAQLPYDALRPVASQGARGLLRIALNLEPHDADYEAARLQFLADYEANSTAESRLFPGIDTLLITLEKRGLSWGIVTNKVTYLTLPIVEYLGLAQIWAWRRRAPLSYAATQQPTPNLIPPLCFMPLSWPALTPSVASILAMTCVIFRPHTLRACPP